jgi:hypothetical protein
MWDQALALDLQSKAEDYLLEHKLRLGIDRAYYRRDVTQHKNAVDEMVLSTLKEYANYWCREP